MFAPPFTINNISFFLWEERPSGKNILAPPYILVMKQGAAEVSGQLFWADSFEQKPKENGEWNCG